MAFAWFYDGLPRFYTHTGATAGFVTCVAVQIDTRTGFLVLSNFGSNVNEIVVLGNALALNLFELHEV